jgi:DNA repair exonuclease SbcCD ATPase subunit
MKKAILTVLLVCLSATIAFAQNRPGAPIETVKKIRDARPSFKELVNEVDRLKQDLVKIEIAITEAKNSITVNNNSRLQDRNEDQQGIIELLGNISQIRVDLASHSGTLQYLEGEQSQFKVLQIEVRKLLEALQNEFETRGKKLLDLKRQLDAAAAGLIDLGTIVEDSDTLTEKQIVKLSGRLDVLSGNIKDLRSQYVEKVVYEAREKELLIRINNLKANGQASKERIKLAEERILALEQQIIENSGQLEKLTSASTVNVSKIARIDGQLLELGRVSNEVELLTQERFALSQKLEALSYLPQRLDEISSGINAVEMELIRLDGDLKDYGDVSELNSEDLKLLIKRLAETRVAQISKVDTDELTSILKRIDELEIIQPDLADQQALRGRVDELYRRQILITDEMRRVNLMEEKLILMETRINERMFLGSEEDELSEEQPKQEGIPGSNYQ